MAVSAAEARGQCMVAYLMSRDAEAASADGITTSYENWDTMMCLEVGSCSIERDQSPAIGSRVHHLHLLGHTRPVTRRPQTNTQLYNTRDNIMWHRQQAIVWAEHLMWAIQSAVPA